MWGSGLWAQRQSCRSPVTVGRQDPRALGSWEDLWMCSDLELTRPQGLSSQQAGRQAGCWAEDLVSCGNRRGSQGRAAA